MVTRIMIIEKDRKFLDECVAYLAGKSEYEIVAISENTEDAVDTLAVVGPDVLLFDLNTDHDGNAVLKRLIGRHKTIVMGDNSKGANITDAFKLGARYYMLKPFAFAQLDKRIAECQKELNKSKLRERSIDERMTNFFCTAGIPADLLGYKFLREAVRMAVNDPDIVNNVTTRLYPEVANRFRSTSFRVERAIRHALTVAWNRKNSAGFYSMLGIPAFNTEERPSNSEFIALVADRILFDIA